MNSLPKLLAAIAIVALIGVGCSSAPANQPAANTPAVGSVRENPASGTLTVHIQPNGEFIPTTAYIKVNTKIVFQNDTDKPQRVASYPDSAKPAPTTFGSPQDIAPGEVYEVTFSQVGRWLYNDPLNQAFGGAVEVSE